MYDLLYWATSLADNLQDCYDLLECLKIALIEENLIQVPELLVAHLCAYLGTAVTVHTVHQAEKLEPLIVDLIKYQANTAYKHFNHTLSIVR